MPETRVDPLVQEYVDERAKHMNTIEVLKTQARERGKDPTDDDLEVIGKAQARIRKLDTLIETLGDGMEMSDALRQKLERSAPGALPATPKYRDAGHLLWDCLHAEFGSQHDRDDREARQRWGMTMERAAQHMGTDAALTTPTAGGFGALYVAPVVGPVIDINPKTQPFLNAIGKTPAPNALSFLRPRIVDPDFKANGAAKQTLQKGELASRKFDVKTDSLSLDTYGGYLNVSQQLLSLHPEALNLIVSQLQRRVAWQGEAAALSELAETTAAVTITDKTDPTEVLSDFFDAAALVFTNTQQLPTWVVMGPLGWAWLGKLTDAADRPLFPYLGAANAFGAGGDLSAFNVGPLGLRPIVTPGITSVDMWMGNDMALEAYSYPFPVLEAIEPSVMGRQVAVAEALGFWRPTTAEGDPLVGNGAVKLDAS